MNKEEIDWTTVVVQAQTIIELIDKKGNLNRISKPKLRALLVRLILLLEGE